MRGARGATLAAVAAAVALAGCGGAKSTPGAHSAPGAFAWLRPGPPPAGWHQVRIPAGAVMAYPPDWHPARGDIGTATVVLLDRRHRFLGYLNVTPRQGGETASNWGTFRPEHNADEGDSHVTTLAHATGLRFRNGRGACVKDSYTTSTGRRFIELACLVSGTRASSVIVGAAPPSAWSVVSPLLERSISSFTV